MAARVSSCRRPGVGRTIAERLRVEPLEGRIVPAGFSLARDVVSVTLPADAVGFPTCDVDVLANDTGTNLRIVSIEPPAFGSVERLVGAGPEGRDLVRYSPGPTFRGRDFFRYAATDAEGPEEWQQVSVGYEQDLEPFGPWRIKAPAAIETASGTSLRLIGEGGEPLISIDYSGPTRLGGVGVLLRWQPDERPGTFTADAVADATFYPQAMGAAWIVGSPEGVNRLLATLSFVPEQGFSAAEGVRLTVQTHLYSPLNVGVGVEFADIVVRVVPDAASPLANDDAFRVRSTTEATLLDVLVNDVPVVDGPLELVDVAIEGHSESEVSIDAATGAIRYRPQQVFMGFERLFYKVRNAAGLTAQGRAVVTVMPEIMAVARSEDDGTGIVVMNAGTRATVSEFRPFPDRPTGDVAVAVGDLDGDGMTEIVAMENDGGQRMRAFTAAGAMIDETPMRPFAGRQLGRIDMGVGDLDGDDAAEMIFAARTRRGVEVRAVDAATKETEMTAVLRGMTGAPEVAFDDETATLSVVARSPVGAVMLATMEAGAKPARRVLVSDRDVRAMVRRNGPMVGLSLSSDDADRDGTAEARVAMTFRSGVVRVFEAEGRERVRVVAQQQVPAGASVTLSSVARDSSGAEAGLVWWGQAGLGVVDGGPEPRLRGRIRGVATG